jgi:hypothetical protein
MATRKFVLNPITGQLDIVDEHDGTATVAVGTTDRDEIEWNATASEWQPKTNESFLTGEPTGFDDPGAVISNYNSAARTITLTGTGWNAYYQGESVATLVSGFVSDPHPVDLDKTYFLAYNGAAFVWLDLSTDAFDFSYLLIAFVYHGTTHKWALHETHGLMQWQSHELAHRTIGTYKQSGGTLNDYVLSSTTAADRRPSVSESVVIDEDLPTTIPALAAGGPYTQYYLTLTGDANFTAAAADIIPLNTAQPYYNLYTGGAWTQTLMNNNNYTAVWVLQIPVTADAGSQAYRTIFIQGQSQSSVLASIQALTPNDVQLGDLIDLTPESVFIAKIIIRYQSANWHIVSVTAITGTHYSQATSPTGAYLSSVTTDATLTGSGVSGDALGVNLANANVWTAAQAFTAATSLPLSLRGGLTFTAYTTPAAPTAALAGAAGNIDNGTHSYKVSFVTALGDSALGTASNVITVVDKTSDGQINLTGIPVSTEIGVISRKIYRTKAGGTTYFLLATIANNTATTYTDNIADATMTVSYQANSADFNVYLGSTRCIGIFSQNVMIGEESGLQNTGTGFTGIGYRSGYQNTGLSFTGAGLQCGYQNTGYSFTGLGSQCGDRNTGLSFTGAGLQCGYQNTGANFTGAGVGCGSGNTGANFTGAGVGCGVSNTGADNAFFGYHAGRYIADGTTSRKATLQSIYIGSGSKSLEDAANANEIVIGYNAIGKGANSLVLGNASTITLWTPYQIHAGRVLTDAAPSAAAITGGTALSTAVTNIVGGKLTIRGGAGASGSAGAANGGDLELGGGVAYGTGVVGNIVTLSDTMIRSDSLKLFFGAGDDCSIGYDGTNMLINPKVVGGGILDIAGTLQVDGYNSADGTAGATQDIVLTDGTISFKNGLFVSWTAA